MGRNACRVLVGVLFLSALAGAAPAAAQDAPQASLRESVDVAAAQMSPTLSPVVLTGSSPSKRPSPLVPLYVSFAALQALDIHSTHRALASGGVEANPLMKGLVGNELALIGVKAAGTAAVVYASERIWKKNRMASVLFMVASNSAMAWVVRHNYGVSR